jgi:hypothetical protein
MCKRVVLARLQGMYYLSGKLATPAAWMFCNMQISSSPAFQSINSPHLLAVLACSVLPCSAMLSARQLGRWTPRSWTVASTLRPLRLQGTSSLSDR